jgi:hypothetical protein
VYCLPVSFNHQSAAGRNTEKGLPATPSRPLSIPANCFLKIFIGNIIVYVSFNEVMLSLQNFYGVFACCNAPLRAPLLALCSLLKTM